MLTINDLSQLINTDKCWIVNYNNSISVKNDIKKFRFKLWRKIGWFISIKWVTDYDEPCYLVLSRLHLVDDNIEKSLKDIIWIKKIFIGYLNKISYIIFNTTLARKFGSIYSRTNSRIEKVLKIMILSENTINLH